MGTVPGRGRAPPLLYTGVGSRFVYSRGIHVVMSSPPETEPPETELAGALALSPRLWVFLLPVNTAWCLHPQIAISLAVRLAGQVLAFKALLNLLGQGL